MALDALLFDLDGTLIDANGLHTRAWRDAFAQYGYTIPADRIAPEIGKGGTMLVPSVVGEAAEAEDGDALRDAHDARYLELVEAEGVAAFPCVERLFRTLRDKGLKTAIATASKKDSLKKATEAAGLDLFDLADAVVTDDDVDESKPNPDVVSAAAQKLGLHPAQCAFVGDTPYDAIAGRRAGAVTLGVLTGVHGPEALHRAGARASYGDLADLCARIDEVLETASPPSLHLTPDTMASLMEAALEEAEAGRAAGQVPIGAVLAQGDGTIIGRGHNTTRATGNRAAHAELRAIERAAGRYASDARDLILVTTLEPCPMCLGAAMNLHVDTVVYALPAPPNGASERCTPPETSYLPRLVGGVRAEASRALLEAWRAEHQDGFVATLLDRLDEKALA